MMLIKLAVIYFKQVSSFCGMHSCQVLMYYFLDCPTSLNIFKPLLLAQVQ